MINGKPYKSLGMIHLEQLKNWKLIKGVSNWVSISLTDSDYPSNSDHFVFGFKTKNTSDLFHFSY